GASGGAHGLHGADGEDVGIVAGGSDGGIAAGGLIASVVAGGDYHDDAVLPGFFDRLAERIKFVTLIDGAAEREVDDANVVARFQRDRLIDGCDHNAIGRAAVG